MKVGEVLLLDHQPITRESKNCGGMFIGVSVISTTTFFMLWNLQVFELGELVSLSNVAEHTYIDS